MAVPVLIAPPGAQRLKSRAGNTAKKPFRFYSCVIVAFGMILCEAGAAWSHPHLFLQTEMHIELNHRGIKGLRQTWIFDEYFSAWLISQYRLPNSGIIGGSDLDLLYRETFDNLKNFNFFTLVIIGDQRIAAKEVSEFSVELKDGLAAYSFFVPLDLAIPPQGGEAFIMVYDESYYCHVSFPPEKIDFTGDTGAWNITYSTTKKSSEAFYFNMIVPKAVRLQLTPP